MIAMSHMNSVPWFFSLLAPGPAVDDAEGKRSTGPSRDLVNKSCVNASPYTTSGL